MPRVAIVVGHSEDAQGARGVDGVTEWTLHMQTASAVVAALLHRGIPAARWTRPTEGTYAERMRDLCDRLNAADMSAVVELHFNADDDEATGKWNGSQALHWPTSARGRELAGRLSAAMAGAVRTRDRGALGQSRSWSDVPLYILQWTRAPAVIAETHYGDHPCDHSQARRAIDNGSLPEAIADAICAWLEAP